MADRLVRARIGERVKNVGESFALKHDLEVVEESTVRPDGRLRSEARPDGRLIKKKTSVAKKAAAKKAAAVESPTSEASPYLGEPTTAEEAN